MVLLGVDLEAKVNSSKNAGRFIGNMDWRLLSLHPSRILTGGGLVVLCSLSESPVVR